jgi:hypothetical protein
MMIIIITSNVFLLFIFVYYIKRKWGEKRERERCGYEIYKCKKSLFLEAMIVYSEQFDCPVGRYFFDYNVY